jgi:hypothetical protein
MDEEKVYREEFNTEDEALAFEKGVEYIDNDHVVVESPYYEGGVWIVEVRKFA